MHQFWCIGNYKSNVERQENNALKAGVFRAMKRASHRRDLALSRAFYFNAPNPEHCPASGGFVLFPTFKSVRITPLSVEQNSRLPVRSKTSEAAAVK
jgi:hypothetical protein